MQIPANHIRLTNHTSVTFDEKAVVITSHVQRNHWETTVLDMTTGRTVNHGGHRAEREALAFADAYVADGGDDIGRKVTGGRYSRAVDAVYSRAS